MCCLCPAEVYQCVHAFFPFSFLFVSVHEHASLFASIYVHLLFVVFVKRLCISLCKKKSCLHVHSCVCVCVCVCVLTHVHMCVGACLCIAGGGDSLVVRALDS